jgi:dTDP-4-dehydrorhamnose 3,5-epimerase-like enzyme
MKMIKGTTFSDHRGSLSFINNFDMKSIRRFYTIRHYNTNIIRAWQGHKFEVKYFHPIQGSFKIGIIIPDNWSNPSKNLKIETIIISSKEVQILHVKGGCISGFKALEQDSAMMVYSDKTLEQSENDDFRWELQYFEEYEKLQKII